MGKEDKIEHDNIKLMRAYLWDMGLVDDFNRYCNAYPNIISAIGETDATGSDIHSGDRPDAIVPDMAGLVDGNNAGLHSDRGAPGNSDRGDGRVPVDGIVDYEYSRTGYPSAYKSVPSYTAGGTEPIAAGVSVGEPTPVDRKCEPSGTDKLMACSPSIAAGEEVKTCPGCDGSGIATSGRNCSQCHGSGNVPAWWLLDAPAEPVVTGLVERLRAGAGQAAMQDNAVRSTLYREAADTITRLEAENDELKTYAYIRVEELTALQSERDEYLCNALEAEDRAALTGEKP
jgi:hypothetical protein